MSIKSQMNQLETKIKELKTLEAKLKDYANKLDKKIISSSQESTYTLEKKLETCTTNLNKKIETESNRQLKTQKNISIILGIALILFILGNYYV